MRSGIAALLALASQILPLAGPGVLMLCVHEDGQARYELAFALCCDESPSSDRGESIGHSRDGSQQPTPGIEPICDRCQDYPVTVSQVPLPSQRTQDLATVTHAFLPPDPLPPSCDVGAPGPWTLSVNYLGPPGGLVLRHLRTIVLQV